MSRGDTSGMKDPWDTAVSVSTVTGAASMAARSRKNSTRRNARNSAVNPSKIFSHFTVFPLSSTVELPRFF